MTFGRQKNFVAFQNTLTQVSKPSITSFSISVELRNIQRFFATKNSFLAKKNPKFIHYLVFKIQTGNQNANLENSKSQKSTLCFLETVSPKKNLCCMFCAVVGIYRLVGSAPEQKIL